MQTMGVAGGATGTSWASAASVCCPFTPSRTAVSSVHLTAAASVTTGMGRVTDSSGASSTKPDSKARAWSPRAIRVTSAPF